jgi:four helix bundle protein
MTKRETRGKMNEDRSKAGPGERKPAAFSTLEEMAAWQKARELTRRIYDVTRRENFRRDYGLVDQIRRASVSAMSNIAEGFERRGSRESAQFLSVAKGSLGDVRAQLCVALDQEYIDPSVFEELTGLACDTSRLLGGLSRYLRRRQEGSDARRDTRTDE